MDEFGAYVPADIDLRELLWISDEIQKNRRDRIQKAKTGNVQHKPRQRKG